MPLGYRGHEDWRDMSEFAVHFTTEGPGNSAYDAMMSILWDRTIEARNAFGAARNVTDLDFSQASVCLSEIPLDQLARLVTRRNTRYGIGFRQDFLVQAGGARVWYVDKDSPPNAAVMALIERAVGPPLDPSHPVWRVTPFIDFPGEYGATQYRFEWEREWRVPHGLDFSSDDVAFLLIPEDLHDEARTFFGDAERKQLGPAYRCPFIDPTWNDEDIQAALASVPVPPVP